MSNFAPFFSHLDDANDARNLAVAVVEEGDLSDLHGSHVIPGEIVPHAVPVRRLLGLRN